MGDDSMTLFYNDRW